MNTNVNVVGMTGGLGNQLFQYAFGLELEAVTGLHTVYDLSAYRRRRAYLNITSLPFPIKKASRWLWFMPHPQGRHSKLAMYIREKAMGPRLTYIDQGASQMLDIVRSMPAYYYGYWQGVDLSENTIARMRAALTRETPDRKLLAAHVRRGDMVGKSDELSLDYYREAYSTLLKKNRLPANTKLDIFTDDPEWCENNLNIPVGKIYSNHKAVADFLLFSEYENMILSASTFSWWAAKLNPCISSVVAPDPFSSGNPNLKADAYWLVVNR